MALIPLLEKDQVEEIAQEVYEKFENKTGKVPEWVKVMAHSPEILKEFTELFNSVMAKKEIDILLKWQIALVISETLKCPFCVNVTQKMLKQLEVGDKMMEEIKNLKTENKDVLELVKDITLDGHLDQPELIMRIKEKFNEAQIVEIVSVIGLFNYINRFNNTLGILPE